MEADSKNDEEDRNDDYEDNSDNDNDEGSQGSGANSDDEGSDSSNNRVNFYGPANQDETYDVENHHDSDIEPDVLDVENYGNPDSDLFRFGSRAWRELFHQICGGEIMPYYLMFTAIKKFPNIKEGCFACVTGNDTKRISRFTQLEKIHIMGSKEYGDIVPLPILSKLRELKNCSV
ncbi:hypothetical protein HDU97_009016 [Phlyctochytrium planicorne]|nr:hypothetical protein HDU97_009016 [Phlyctochytrium planicorne]